MARGAFGLQKQTHVSEAYVATSFGLFIGILRQTNSKFHRVFKGLPGIVNAKFRLSDFGANSSISGANADDREETTQTLSEEIKDQHGKILNLEKNLFKSEDDVKRLQNQLESLKQQLQNVNMPEEDFEPPEKKPKFNARADDKTQKVYHTFKYIAAKYQTSISSVMGNMVVFSPDSEAKDDLCEMVDMLVEKKGAKTGLKEILSDDSLKKYLRELRVPDWVLLYFKLSSTIPDEAWQTLLNVTHLGRSGVSTRA